MADQSGRDQLTRRCRLPGTAANKSNSRPSPGLHQSLQLFLSFEIQLYPAKGYNLNYTFAGNYSVQ